MNNDNRPFQFCKITENCRMLDLPVRKVWNTGGLWMNYRQMMVVLYRNNLWKKFTRAHPVVSSHVRTQVQVPSQLIRADSRQVVLNSTSPCTFHDFKIAVTNITTLKWRAIFFNPFHPSSTSSNMISTIKRTARIAVQKETLIRSVLSDLKLDYGAL